MLKTEQKQGAKLLDIIRLALLLASLLLFGIVAAVAAIPSKTSQTVGLAAYMLWVLLVLESVFAVSRMNRLKRSEYFKFNKLEIAFVLGSLIALPLSITLGQSLWVLILVLKLPAALRPFNDEKIFQVVINLIVVLLILFFFLPFLNVLAVSLSSPDQIVNLLPKRIDLFSVQFVTADKNFFRAMGISVFVTAVGTLLSVLSMSMAAYPLSKPRMPFRKATMLFFIIVMLFTGGMAPNMLLMNILGLTNTVWALIFPSVTQVFYLILLKGFFADIPEELEESARLDGASNYKILFRIIFPVAAPMIATVAFFTVIHYWNNINNSILYITSNQSVYPLPMYIRNFLHRNPMEVASVNPQLMAYWNNVKMTYILFSIVPVLLVYPFSFRYLKNGVSMGAVKG